MEGTKSAVLRGQTRRAKGRRAGRLRIVESSRWPAFMTLLAIVAACGGGDDAGPGKELATLPVEKPIEQPIVTMPSSTYTGKHLEAFTRINEARIAAGVSALKQSAELDKAAQAHADYLVFNNVLSHEEDASKPMFTGVDSWRRAITQGYKNAMRGEVIARVVPTLSGTEHVDWHLNSVYHLQRVLTPNANEIGIGFKSTTYAADRVTSSISLGVTDARMPSVKEPRVWPVPSASGVPIAFRPTEEVPNPLPDVATNGSVTVGPPIMYCRTAGVTSSWSVTSAQIVESASKASVESWLLQQPYSVLNALPHVEHRTDALLGRDGMDCMFLIPKRPLQPGATYNVSIATSLRGIITNTDWSFTTIR